MVVHRANLNSTLCKTNNRTGKIKLKVRIKGLEEPARNVTNCVAPFVIEVS